MGTLYDLLGALPSDGAESLRTAFRKAAKASHPDINPDNPDASLRFRELVRAYDILNDPEQRATYDELLAIALQPPAAKSTRVYETMRKLATGTIAATMISAASVAGYIVFAHVTKAQDAAEITVDAAAGGREEVAAVAPTVQIDPAAIRNALRDARAAAAAGDGMIMMAAVTPATFKDSDSAINAADANASPATNPSKSYRERGLSAYRGGDMDRALADFDLAIQRDPGFAEAYLNRGIVLYQMHQFNRAFADMDKARRILNSSHGKTSSRPPRKPAPVAARVEPKYTVQNTVRMTAAVTP